MMKYELAYYEAQKVLLRNNCISEELTKEFNLDKILDYELPALNTLDSHNSKSHYNTSSAGVLSGSNSTC